jgi:hypothetical protein
MKKSWLSVVLFGGTLLADTQFTVRQMTRTDVPSGQGQCDIRLRIDDEAEVEFRGQQVYIRTLRGQDGRDEGSECNVPFPRNAQNVRLDKRDGRGDLRLINETRRGVIVYIRDSEGGAGRYHFRLTWDDVGGGRFNDGLGRGNDDFNRGRGNRGGVFDDDRNRRGGIFDDNRGGGVFNGNRPGQFSGEVRGDGDLQVGARNARIRRVGLDLRRGGRFTMTLDGQVTDTVEGNWRYSGNNEVLLDVDRTRSGRAQGTGRVLLRGNDVSDVNLTARDGRSGEQFVLNFRAR